MDLAPAWSVTSFYCFFEFGEADLKAVQQSVKEALRDREMLGLVILAPEGINATVAGSAEAISSFKAWILELLEGAEVHFKDSVCTDPPFRRINVYVRQEIVSMRRPDMLPPAFENSHLSPDAWHELMTSGEEIQVIDTRNDYEFKIGAFKGSINPGLSAFSEWGAYLDQADLRKDIPSLIFCTGGIRCEKAILEMHARGYDKVYQLRDGILAYLESHPDGLFEGECFVFDDRVAVDSHLQPSKRYALCPATGHPFDNWRPCAWCGTPFVLDPAMEETWGPVCSKTCQDRVKRHGLPKAKAARE